MKKDSTTNLNFPMPAMGSYPQPDKKDYLFEKGHQMSEDLIAFLEQDSCNCPRQSLDFSQRIPSRRCSGQSEDCVEKALYDDENAQFRLFLDQKINGGDFNVSDDDVESLTGTGSDEEDEKVVPDGGWGWVVCFGSFMVNFILDGTMFSFGVLLLYLLDDFGEDEATTSWVGSAQMGVHMCMGPVISYLLKRYTIRQVTITGSLLATAGFIASVFAPNIYVLIFTFGVIGGIGFGMAFLPALIVVGLYFNRKRAIATGIATSGSGVGVFAYAYITDTLVQSYGWRGTVLILAGVLLNCLVCGLLFRPLLNPKVTEKKVSAPPSVSSKPKRPPSDQDDHSASSGYSSKPASVKLSTHSILSGASTEDLQALNSDSTQALRLLYTEIEPAMEKSKVWAEVSRRFSESIHRGGEADVIANEDTNYSSSYTHNTMLISKIEHVADDEICCDCEKVRTVSVSGGYGDGRLSDVNGDLPRNEALVVGQNPVPLVLVSDFSDVADGTASSPLMDSTMQLCETPCIAQTQRQLLCQNCCKHISKELNGGLLPNTKNTPTAKNINIVSPPVNHSDIGLTQPSHTKSNLPWFVKEVQMGRYFNRPFNSVDHIHRIDTTNTNRKTSPLTHQRLLSSEHDFNRKLSLFAIESPPPSPPIQLNYESKTDIQNQICKGLMKPILRRDIYYSGSINNLPTFQQYGGSISTFMAAMTRASSVEESEDALVEAGGTCSDSVCCQRIKRFLPMHLLGNKCFVFLLITFTMWTAQSSFMTYLPQLAVSLDIARSDAASLISVVGIANVLGRLLAGLIIDCLRVPGIWLYVIALSVAACICLTIPFVTSFIVLQVCSALFGLCMAVAVSMRTIVLAEQLGIEALTESFGVVAFFQGIAFTINPPIAGTLIDVFDSYTLPFFMAAGMYAVSAVCSLLCGLFTAAENRRMRSASMDKSHLVLSSTDEQNLNV